jgi:hypothetical protein
LITNGVFAADTNWTKGTGWTIAAGVASSSGAQSDDADLTQTITPTAGLIYKVVFTVSGYSAGNVCAVVGDTEGTDRAANGTYTEYIMAGAGTDFDIRADLNFVGSIDNVAVYATSLNLYHLQGSVTFKGRVYFWEKAAGTNPQSFWYAAAGAYTGALVKFDLTEFTEGGYVAACANWTHDGGQGLDDHFVVIMSTGQVLVYAGSDPGDATDWNLVGIYSIGEPIGLRPVSQLGGDVIVLTKDGYIVLSAAIQDGRYSENSHYSFKISPAAARAAKDYGSNYGWEGTLYTGGSLFVVNVPLSATNSVQHVRNTTTGAWCKFTGLNATTWCVHGGGLYFAGTDGKVYRYRGSSDNSGYIPMRCTQAYNYFGSPHNKKLVTAIEVMSNYAFPAYLHSDFWADFNEQDLPAIDDPPEPASSEWDVATWDVAEWATSTQGTNTARRNASCFGYAIAHTLRLRSRVQRFIWYASHIYAKQAGVV